MNLQQLLQWQESGKSGGSLEKYRFHSGRRGASVAAGSDWSLRSTEEGPLEQKASEKPRTDTVKQQKLEVTVETLILTVSKPSKFLRHESDDLRRLGKIKKDFITLSLTSTPMTWDLTQNFIAKT